MVIIREESSRYKELVQTIAPLVQRYAKSSASPRGIICLSNRLAAVLEEWDYSPKEIKNLDRRAFMDLIQSWQAEGNAEDIALIKATF